MKAILKLIVIFFLIAIAQSCQSQPDSKTIRKCIKRYYNSISIQDGSGTYNISEIKILKVKKRKNEKVWEVKTFISGTYENGSLPNDEGPRDYKRETLFLFSKNKSKQWECRIKHEE